MSSSSSDFRLKWILWVLSLVSCDIFYQIKGSTVLVYLLPVFHCLLLFYECSPVPQALKALWYTTSLVWNLWQCMLPLYRPSEILQSYTASYLLLEYGPLLNIWINLSINSFLKNRKEWRRHLIFLLLMKSWWTSCVDSLELQPLHNFSTLLSLKTILIGSTLWAGKENNSQNT